MTMFHDRTRQPKIICASFAPLPAPRLRQTGLRLRGGGAVQNFLQNSSDRALFMRC